MSSRRTLTMIGALVVGALGALALFQYVGGVEDRAYAGARRVKVLVVTTDIGKGMPGEKAVAEGLVDEDLIPEEFRPASAVTDPAQLAGLVSLHDLAAGQVVVAGMFVDPASAVLSFSQRIPDGLVAVTISVDQVRGVANLLVPGDKVNIMVDDPTAPVEDGQKPPKRHLFQNVEVLAIGTSAAPPPEGATEELSAAKSGLITLAVPPLAAERIAFVGSDGIYLTLVPPDNEPVIVPPVSGDNLFADELTPYGGDRV